jgi:hypothetical protein
MFVITKASFYLIKEFFRQKVKLIDDFKNAKS